MPTPPKMQKTPQGRYSKCLLEWLRRLCKVCVLEEKVPNDWMRAIIVPIYMGKGDRTECKNHRGINLFSILLKVHERILTEKVCSLTERGLAGKVLIRCF